MARKKVEAEKEIIELSEEECPYELPEGWKWERLGDIYQVNPKNNADNEIEAAFIPMSEIEAGFDSCFNYEITTWEKAKKGHTQFANGDVAFAKISPCFENRKSFIVENLPNGIGAGTTELIILRNYNILSEYTYRFITSEAFINDCKSTYSGTVGQQRIDSKFVKKYLIPIPPKETQQKIVDIIESLFDKLDIAQEKVEQVLSESENRRSAILHNAFNGKMTEKWREENGVSFDTWKTMLISDVAKVKGGKRVPKGMSLVDENTGHPYIKAGNLKQSTVIDDNMQYVPSDVLEIIKNYTVKAGDVYITNVGACIGDCGIIPPKYDGANLTENAVKLTELKCESLYLSRLLSSTNIQNYIKKSIASATLGKLSIAKINELKITVASIEEQKEIVRLLDKFLSVEDKVKSTCQSTLETITAMRKSILAKAFRGELYR